ncbi:MAG: preprotein translocase subunit SecE [Bacilli bacterium]|nr:preprotein translocase subunit SecE [Bacilli bacterium]
MGVRKYASEVVKEGKRVRWPKREEFIPALVAVLVVCIVAALFLSLEDWAAGSLIQQIKELFKGMSISGNSSSVEEGAEAIRLFLLK